MTAKKMMRSTKSSSTKSGKSTSNKSSRTSPSTLDVTKNISCSVRQIENGFVINESGYVGRGKNARYESKEYFSQTNPIAAAKIPQLKLSGRKK